MKDLYSVV